MNLRHILFQSVQPLLQRCISPCTSHYVSVARAFRRDSRRARDTGDIVLRP